MNTPATLRLALERLGTLPPVPLVAQRILALKINSDESERALLDLIEKDPPILARVIGLANSPLFGTSRRILSLHDAVAILGSKRVKMVALSFAMMSAMTNRPGSHLDVNHLWLHSLSVAMAMDTLARHMPQAQRPSDEELYLAGLLHDIGFLVLDYIDADLSARFHARLSAEAGLTVEALEAGMLETSHGELGAELARHWSLPESIATVLRYHHAPDDPRAGGLVLTHMTHLAEKLLPTFGLVEPVATEIGDAEWQALGIDPAQGAAIRRQIGDHSLDLGDLAGA